MVSKRGIFLFFLGLNLFVLVQLTLVNRAYPLPLFEVDHAVVNFAFILLLAVIGGVILSTSKKKDLTGFLFCYILATAVGMNSVTYLVLTGDLGVSTLFVLLGLVGIGYVYYKSTRKTGN